MNPVAIHLGPLEIRWYAICIVTGLVLAVYLAMKEAPRKRILDDDVLDFILIAFPLAIIGARIYYVAFEWDQYKGNLSEIFAIWHGGIAIYGGLIAGFLVLIWFCYRRAIHPWDFLDIAAPVVLLAQSIGRWGNFFNQEAYGAKVSQLHYLPSFIREQMWIEGSYRQPTFLFESVWNLIGFILIVSIRHKPNLLKRGEPTLFYLVWYGVGRFWIEGLRTDSLMLGGLRVSQWLSALLVLVGIILFLVRRRNKEIPNY